MLAVLYIPARIGIRAAIDAGEPQLRNFYPAELVLTLKDGTVTTNVRQPYYIDPTFWEMVREKKADDKEGPEHFITINTRAAIDDFADYNTAILITRTHVVMQNDHQLRAYDLADIDKDMVINKQVYDGFVSAAVPFIRMIPAWVDIAVIIGLILMPFIGAGVSWVWHLFTLLIWSFVFWAVSAIMGKGLRYWQIYRLGIYGLTLPVILSTFLGFLPGIGLASSAVFVIFMLVVLTKMPRPTMPAHVVTKKITSPRKKAVKKKAKTTRE